MTESAKCQASGLRARKRAATRSAITTAARILTAQNGLNGFTIEQVCEEVGVSRRTFFNYFPSKEDAILGHFQDDFPAQALEVFLHGAGRGVDAGHGRQEPGESLMQALFRLTCAVVEEMSLTRADQQDLIAVMQKEPQLIMKMLGNVENREKEFAALIARREGLSAHDPAAALAAAFFGLCSHKAGQAFFRAENTSTFADLLASNLQYAQQLFNSASVTIEGPR
ncbi:TetR/AcrR family transcriptional regulator [Specibacter sp. NPDC057265]|uniref:TetR/AcrR family transcriptional regulator n=1 Tax=Specibacter sp. NPDC057265 TaxID=3346075 RepID=UPI00363AEDE7